MRCMLLIVGALLLSTSSASASRPATQAEKRALARAGARPARCFSERVSTAQRGWAITVLLTPSRGCPVGNGFDVYQRTKTRWKRVYGASDTSARCSQVHPIPARVARDLKVCAGLNPYPW